MKKVFFFAAALMMLAACNNVTKKSEVVDAVAEAPVKDTVVYEHEYLVKVGDVVKAGDRIAAPGNGLSVAIHASMDGVVQAVTDKYITIAER